MQQEKKLKKLLKELQDYNEILAVKYGLEKKIILVKIAPLTSYEEKPEKIKDLSKSGLEMITNVFNESGIDGVTATNTSQEHNLGTKIVRPDGQTIGGGLSGLGLHNKSLETVRELRKMLDNQIPIIGVGGIGYDEKGKDATDMLNAGAKGLGILSSFVQKGVATPYNIKKNILKFNK